MQCSMIELIDLTTLLVKAKPKVLDNREYGELNNIKDEFR